MDHEAEPVHGRADHWDPARAGGWGEDGRRLPQARDQQRHLLQMEGKYGGLEVSDARRLKALEDENAKLKKLLAEAMLDNAMLKDIAAKKW
jgi:putative transposase